MIDQRMSEKAAGKARRKDELEKMTITESRVIEKVGRKVTINRVIPPQLKEAPPGKFKRDGITPSTSKGEFKSPFDEHREHQWVSLSATVYGEEYSRVIWRNPDKSGEEERAPEELEIWTNINFNYLRPISAFERDGVIFDYFTFTETVTRENENKRKAFAHKHGFTHETRWRESPVEFTTGDAEYVVIAPDEREIPRKLYQQLNALFAYYLENEEALKTRVLRNEALREAKTEYLRKNPPEPEDVIINHWPVSEGGGQ